METLFASIPSLLRIVAHLFRLILFLGDELPPHLHPVPYPLGLPLQSLELRKHRSVPGEGRMVSVRRTLPEVFHYAFPFLTHPERLLLILQIIAYYCYQFYFLQLQPSVPQLLTTKRAEASHSRLPAPLRRACWTTYPELRFSRCFCGVRTNRYNPTKTTITRPRPSRTLYTPDLPIQ